MCYPYFCDVNYLSQFVEMKIFIALVLILLRCHQKSCELFYLGNDQQQHILTEP